MFSLFLISLLCLTNKKVKNKNFLVYKKWFTFTMKFFISKSVLKKTELLVVGLIWAVAIFTPAVSVIDSEYGNFYMELKMSLMGSLPFFILFLVNHFLLVEKFLFSGKTWKFIILNLALVVSVFFASKYWTFGPEHEQPPFLKHEMPKFDDKNFPHRPHKGPPFKSLSLVISVLVIGCDCGVKLSFRYLQLRHEDLEKQKQNSENRLSQLKHQISPHFFMNTLNNIHALVDIDPELAKEAVIRLSKLMRYVLYQTKEGSSDLASEIEFMQSYISLMRLRFSEKVKINFTIAEDLPEGKKIPSLIFISMIENAFKHGISYKKQSFVDIKLFAENNEKLVFICENSLVENDSVNNKKEKKEGGIGQENTINRLDLVYGKNYTLDINKDLENEIYRVKIIIPLL